MTVLWPNDCRGREGQVTPIFWIFLLVGLKEACMPNFSFLGSFLQLFHYYSGRAARQLEELKIRRTQPVLAGTGAELGNICHYVLVHGFHLYCWSNYLMVCSSIAPYSTWWTRQVIQNLTTPMPNKLKTKECPKNYKQILN